jgi:hypothetical protein
MITIGNFRESQTRFYIYIAISYTDLRLDVRLLSKYKVFIVAFLFVVVILLTGVSISIFSLYRNIQ